MTDTLRQIETKAFLEMVELIKKLEQDLAQANARVRELESQVFGGSVK
jgi:hypothetical protein